MESDDNSHYLIYRALGISVEEGRKIDLFQNKGRFLYKYAGTFVEKATKACFLDAFPESKSVRIKNTVSTKPKTFEIDCLVDDLAIEIKWRDATTDGDHITKEHERVKAIKAAGYKPVRLMFFAPNRLGAQKVQRDLEKLYKTVGGEYHAGKAAWDYVKRYTNTDLFAIINDIADLSVALSEKQEEMWKIDEFGQ